MFGAGVFNTDPTSGESKRQPQLPSVFIRMYRVDFQKKVFFLGTFLLKSMI